jgi:hypothetical protein
MKTHMILFINICPGYQVKEVVMGEECGMHRTVEKWIKGSDEKDHWRVGRLRGKILLK